jgi:Immunity protein 26
MQQRGSKPMKLPYSEGSVFRVPLRNDGAARGVIARAGRTGKVLLGYFFGPCLSSFAAAKTDDLDPDRAILRAMFGDLGLITGQWTVLGKVPNWDRAKWPMPDFVRRDPLGRRKPILVRYSDADPQHIEAEYPIADDRGLAADVLSGYGAIEIKLTKLLRRRADDRRADQIRLIGRKADDRGGLALDSLYGYGAIEIELDTLLHARS